LPFSAVVKKSPWLFLLASLAFAPLAPSQVTNNPATKIPATNAPPPLAKAAQLKIFANQKNWAIEKVQKIVNQPVPALPVDLRGNNVSWCPYWFHEGANTPDFDTVDVRTTQDLHYKDSTYVGSDLNPSVMYVGAGLEFNSNLKYFYTDRSVPKKKLTEVEMLEINRLYRIIANDDRQLIRLQLPAAASATK
jgi:hypothetical protein